MTRKSTEMCAHAHRPLKPLQGAHPCSWLQEFGRANGFWDEKDGYAAGTDDKGNR